MFSEPTINDHLDKTRRSLAAEIDALQSSLAGIYSDHAARGILTSSMTVQRVWAETVKSGVAGIEIALRELQRTIQSTKLNAKELRDHTVNELENFRLQLEAIGREKSSNVVQVGMEAFVDRENAKLREDLRYMIRQFDVGFFQPSQGEAKMTTNNSITVHSLVGNISQNSPNSTQSTNIDVGDLRYALASFSEALKAAALPSEKLDEILSDVATIHAQLSKQSPSGGIIQEAGKSIRNVIEGVAAGLLTPQVSITAVALFRAVGLA